MGASFRPKACRKAVRRALKADQLVLAAALLSAGLMKAPTQGRLLRQAALLVRRRRNQLVALGLTRPAQGWVLLALRRRPGDAPLLRTARDLWRASGDRWGALAFSARLRRLPEADAQDSCREVELLLLAGRTRQARWRVGGALRRYPRDKELLCLASDVCRLQGQWQASWRHARALVCCHPRSWRGYARGAEDLLALQRPQEAQAWVQRALRGMTLPELAARCTAGLRLEMSLRYLANPRTRCLVQAWQASQVWLDPQLREPPLPLRVAAVPPGGTLAPPDPWLPQPIRYWSQGRPPQDVERLAARWDALLLDQGLPPVQWFSRASARQWIAAQAPEYLLPFETAFHMAVEADVFRLAYASRHDCLYLDADLAPAATAARTLALLLEAGSSALYLRTIRPTLSNCLFLARQGCPYFSLVARSGVHLDFRRRPQTVSTVMNSFGPDKYTYCLRHLLSTSRSPVRLAQLAPGVVRLQSSRFRLSLVNEQVITASDPADLAYKQTDQHWIRAIS